MTKGYGCFCHPECAVAFLMNENIDTSVKFERYFLLNSIYGPIYNYNKSIKPAANPHFLLKTDELLERCQSGSNGRGFQCLDFEQGHVNRSGPAIVQSICARRII